MSVILVVILIDDVPINFECLQDSYYEKAVLLEEQSFAKLSR